MKDVTVWSRGGVGETYKITLWGTGPTKGRIEIGTWKAGREANTGAPDSVLAYDLYHVRVEQNGDLKCQVDLPGWLDPMLTCRLEHPNGTLPRATIWVGFSIYTYPLSTGDFAALGEFMVPGTFA